MTYSTIHKAKGTEADYVILLDTGPPRAAEQQENLALEQALSPFRGSDTAAEEERRIWYAALTRARRKVYVIVVADASRHSPFTDELYYNVDRHYDVGEDELAEFLVPLRLLVPCSKCQHYGRTRGVLVLRNGSNGPFASCNSFSSGPDYHCGHTERACGGCLSGLMIRLRNGHARCQNPDCQREVPLCQCMIPTPMVERLNRKTGKRFLGCQRFGSRQEKTCASTKPIRHLVEPPRAERKNVLPGPRHQKERA